MEKKKWYRANEAGEYLSVSKGTIWLYARQGKLNAKKISPRVTVFDIDELNSLLNAS